MTDDIAEVAKGLTKGQTDCVLGARYCGPRAYGVEHWELSGRSANSLTLKGIAKGREIRSFTGRSRRGIVLTPLGLAVRSYLQSKGGEV